MRAFGLIFLLFIVDSLLFSQTKMKINCDSAQTQFELNQCAIQEYNKVNKELNELYNEIVELLQGRIKKASDIGDGELEADTKQFLGMFIEVQEKWIQYRDSFCMLIEKEYKGGSILPLELYGTKTKLTVDRFKDLDYLMSDLER